MSDEWKDKYIDLLEKHNEALLELSQSTERLYLIVFIIKRIEQMRWGDWTDLLEKWKTETKEKLDLPEKEYRIIFMTGERSDVKVFNLSDTKDTLDNNTIDILKEILDNE